MKKFLILLAISALVLAAGCGGGGDSEQAAEKAEGAAAEGTEVAVHDCDGGCGMTKVPVDQLTVVDGKYLCAGCEKSAKSDEHKGHDHDGHDHDGHSH